MKKLLFLGDSITDSHRLWLPSEYEGLGDGFVKMIADKLKPQNDDIEIINRGHDGLTLPHLIQNLERDCFCLNPDVITILIGINDVGVSMQTAVSLREQQFKTCFLEMIESIRQHTDVTLLLMSPFIFPHPLEYQNWIPETLYAEDVIRKAATSYDIPFCSLHDTLNKAAEAYGYDAITTDGIHLTEMGSQYICDSWMKLYESERAAASR